MANYISLHIVYPVNKRIWEISQTEKKVMSDANLCDVHDDVAFT